MTVRKFRNSSIPLALSSGISLVAGLLAVVSAPVYAQNKSEITVAISEDIRGEDPQRERDGMSGDVQMHVVEGLMAYNDALEVKPMLASDLEISDDGAKYVFTLREGVTFHNGAPLTAQEIKWSWDYLMAEGSLWRCKAVYDGPIKVESVEVTGPMEVTYTLAEPNGSFVYNLARTDCAGTPVIHPDSLDGNGDWDRVVGTGPFRLAERKVGEFVVLEKFDGYSAVDAEPSGLSGRKEALVDRVRFRVVSDEAARSVGLRSGDLDIAPLTTKAVPQLQGEEGVLITSAPTTVWYCVLLNTNDPLLQNKALRQAVAAAIDVDQVAQGVSYGQWDGSLTPMPKASALYSPPEKLSPAESMARAKSLLGEAGYEGKTITLMTTKAYPSMFDQAVIVQAMLQSVGINVEIKTLEWGVLLDHYTNGTYQSESFGYSGRFDPLGAWERIIGPESRKVWKDPEAIALLAEGMKATDPAKMREVSNRLYEMFADQVPAVSLYHVAVSYGVSDRLEGFKASPLEAARVWNVAVK